jgi:hypothetical protein
MPAWLAQQEDENIQHPPHPVLPAKGGSDHLLPRGGEGLDHTALAPHQRGEGGPSADGPGEG